MKTRYQTTKIILLKRIRIPDEILSLSCMLSVGQVVPIRTFPNPPALSLLMKMDDFDLNQIVEQPPITVMPGLVVYNNNGSKLPLLYFLVRVDDDKKMTYGLQFNIFQKDQLLDLQFLCKQNGLDILLVDGKTCLSFRIFPQYHKHLHVLFSLAKKHANKRMSPTDCLQLSQLITRRTGDAAGLWSLFVKFHGVVQLAQTKRTLQTVS